MASINLMPAAAAAPNAAPQRVVDAMARTLKNTFSLFMRQFALDQYGDMVIVENSAEAYYIQALTEMSERSAKTLFVSLTHIRDYNEQLEAIIVKDYNRYEPVLSEVLYEAMKEYQPNHPDLDVSSRFRDAGASSIVPQQQTEYNVFQVSVHKLDRLEGLRACKTERLGQLMRISGTVTRTSQVRPELIAATFWCADCRTVNKVSKYLFVDHARNI